MQWNLQPITLLLSLVSSISWREHLVGVSKTDFSCFCTSLYCDGWFDSLIFIWVNARERPISLTISTSHLNFSIFCLMQMLIKWSQTLFVDGATYESSRHVLIVVLIWYPERQLHQTEFSIFYYMHGWKLFREMDPQGFLTKVNSKQTIFLIQHKRRQHRMPS